MVRLDARLSRLEGRGRGIDDPAQVREWVAMMTALIASVQERKDVTPAVASEIRECAEEYVRRGIPPTVGDWFRDLREIVDAEEVRA